MLLSKHVLPQYLKWLFVQPHFRWAMRDLLLRYRENYWWAVCYVCVPCQFVVPRCLFLLDVPCCWLSWSHDQHEWILLYGVQRPLSYVLRSGNYLEKHPMWQNSALHEAGIWRQKPCLSSCIELLFNIAVGLSRFLCKCVAIISLVYRHIYRLTTAGSLMGIVSKACAFTSHDIASMKISTFAASRSQDVERSVNAYA